MVMMMTTMMVQRGHIKTWHAFCTSTESQIHTHPRDVNVTNGQWFGIKFNEINAHTHRRQIEKYLSGMKCPIRVDDHKKTESIIIVVSSNSGSNSINTNQLRAREDEKKAVFSTDFDAHELCRHPNLKGSKTITLLSKVNKMTNKQFLPWKFQFCCCCCYFRWDIKSL